MNFKKWIPLVAAFGLMVMVVGVASGASNVKHKTRTLTRACFWVETKGDRVTYHDVKISKLNRTDVRFCIVGKPGKQGKTVRGVAGLAGPVGPQGAKGENGAQGANGETGAAGPKGEQGEMGLQGLVGLAGLTGDRGAERWT